jgi:hypothetical protein
MIIDVRERFVEQSSSSFLISLSKGAKRLCEEENFSD